MAASIWLRSKPMASILAIASARWAPMARPEESWPPALGSDVLCGVGVAGTAGAAELPCEGAAGAAGVLVTGWAGVAGGAAEDSAGAGFSFG